MNQLNEILYKHRFVLEAQLTTLRGICNNITTNGDLWNAQQYWHANDGAGLQRAYTVADHYVNTLKTIVKHSIYDDMCEHSIFIDGKIPCPDCTLDADQLIAATHKLDEAECGRIIPNTLTTMNDEPVDIAAVQSAIFDHMKLNEATETVIHDGAEIVSETTDDIITRYAANGKYSVDMCEHSVYINGKIPCPDCTVLKPLIEGTVPTADDAASLIHDNATIMHTVVVLMNAGGMECIKCNADELPAVLKTRREMDCDIYVDGIPVLDGKLQADKVKYIIEGLNKNYTLLCSRACDHDGLWDAVHAVYYTKHVQYIRVNDELCSCSFNDSNLIVELPELTTTLGANCDPITDDLLANQKRMHL